MILALLQWPQDICTSLRDVICSLPLLSFLTLPGRTKSLYAALHQQLAPGLPRRCTSGCTLLTKPKDPTWIQKMNKLLLEITSEPPFYLRGGRSAF
jgi:hypothetical protein